MLGGLAPWAHMWVHPWLLLASRQKKKFQLYVQIKNANKLSPRFAAKKGTFIANISSPL